MCNKSESIIELAKALVKFNGEVSKISKDTENPFFKKNYATLDNIIDEIRPILQRHGLSIMQMPGGDGENVIMRTMLLHETGEWIESDPLIMKPVKNDPQAVGSCITYARRYSLAAILSLNTGEDDDGNKATHPVTPQQVGQQRLQQEQGKATQRQQSASPAAQSATQTDNSNPLTEGQVKMFWVRAKQAGVETKEQKEAIWELLSEQLARTVSSTDHLQKNEFNGILKWFEQKQAEAS